MSTHLIFPTTPTKENFYNSENYGVVVDLVRSTIIQGVSSLGDTHITISLLGMQGETLWISDGAEGNFEIANLLSSNLTDAAKARLFSEPIELNGVFYYWAPVYSHTGEILLVMALSSNRNSCSILLALTQSLAREASEKLKLHYYMQNTPNENKVVQKFDSLDIQSVEKELIIEVAQNCKGKIQKMHQLLNMGRTTLWRKLKQYEINIKDYK